MIMNRYKLTYRRSRVEEYVLALSSETLDEDGVEKKSDGNMEGTR
jgi:hypothetical protein